MGKYGKENKKSKIVDKYDLNGNLVESFDCLMDVVRKYNYNSGTLCHAIYKHRPYKNYI
uniref:GIY-YIG nuclease superfamily protein n=1 Tax=CrAss-like virus sp. ctYsL76 TaxID=2826826 RepID=A0A8S5QLV2_9CAUD|nr:MAG TPA: GIY-YIG nuclease superfamily protein [CrAss-like virus sp. ctYsL76]